MRIAARSGGGFSSTSSRNKMVGSAPGSSAHGVPAAAASNDRQPPRRTPSPRPGRRAIRSSGSLAYGAPSPLTAERKLSRWYRPPASSHAIIGPWNVTSSRRWRYRWSAVTSL